jgi:hypothetical protein
MSTGDSSHMQIGLGLYTHPGVQVGQICFSFPTYLHKYNWSSRAELSSGTQQKDVRRGHRFVLFTGIQEEKPALQKSYLPSIQVFK